MKNYKFIYHNDWSDPEIEYKGYRFNYWDIETALWEDFKEQCDDTEDEDDAFEDYKKENMEELLEDWLYALDLTIDEIYEHAPDWYEQLQEQYMIDMLNSDAHDCDDPNDPVVIKDYYKGISFVVDDFWAAA